MTRRLLRAYGDAYAGLPRGAWLLSAVLLLNRCGTMVLPFLTLYATERLHCSETTAGALLSSYGLGAIVGTGAGGWLADRVGPFRVQITSLVGTGVGFWAISAIDNAVGLAIGLFVVGILAEAFRPANMAALAALCTPAQTTRAFGLNRLAINLGAAIGPSVGGFLARSNYAWLFFLDGATCLLAAAVLFRFPATPSPTAESPTAPAAVATSPWRDRVFIASLLLTMLVAIIFFQFFNTFPLHLRDHYGFNEATIGLLFAVNPVLIVLLEMLLLRRLEYHAPLPWIGLGALLTGAGLALLPFGSTLSMALASVVVLTFGEMLFSPLLTAFVASRTTASNRGRYMGAYGQAFSIPLVLAPIVGASIYGGLGPMVLWLSCGVTGLLTALGFVALARIGRSRAA